MSFLRLKDIASISTGVTFRSRIEASGSGALTLIQMKDLGGDNTVHLKAAVRIDHPMPRGDHLLRSGDIIFRSRGVTNTAALLRDDAEDTILAAPLFRVRPDIRKVMPEFLLWWINQPISQNYLSSRSKGTMVKMVSKISLENLEVSLPPLERQKKITQYFSLSVKEQSILDKIKHYRALLAQVNLIRMVSESRSYQALIHGRQCPMRRTEQCPQTPSSRTM